MKNLLRNFICVGIISQNCFAIEGTIVGESDASRAAIPMMNIKSTNSINPTLSSSLSCGGVVINDRYIVTALHCLDKRYNPDGGNNYDFNVVHINFALPETRDLLIPRNIAFHNDGFIFGDWDTIKNNFEPKPNIPPYIIVAENEVKNIYIPQTINNYTPDIAILELKSFLPQMGPTTVTLPTRTTLLANPRIYGWSTDLSAVKNEQSNSSGYLREKELISPAAANSLINARQNGACTGDSGSPILQSDGGTLTLIGILSHGVGAADLNGCYNGFVATDVRDQLGWINHVLTDQLPPSCQIDTTCHVGY